MKLLLRIALTVVAFTVASGATYVAIHRWKAVEPKPNAIKTTGKQDTLEGVNGLTAGEVVTLPQLTTLAGDTVNLGNGGKERLLCVFISTRCPGCTRDAELWQELNKEAAKKDASFYLINVSNERAEVERFVAAYNLQQLPILFDPTHKVGPQLKVGFVPQYILFDQTGQVLHRWDGIRHYDKSGGSGQLAEFFQPELANKPPR
jgi:peroxiredoxin